MSLEALHFQVLLENVENMGTFDLNALDGQGRTLLHHAAGSLGRSRNANFADVEACRHLLARKDFAGVNVKDNRGRTALWEAAWRGHSKICMLILGSCDFIEVNAVNHDRGFSGHTALHYACEKGLVVVCRKIVNHPCFDGGNQQGCGGWTALHDAARAGSADICKLLLKHMRFSAINAKDRHGRTASDCARSPEVRDIIRNACIGNHCEGVREFVAHERPAPLGIQEIRDLVGHRRLALQTSMDAMHSWLSDLDEHLLIYLEGFRHLGLYSPDQILEHYALDGELDVKLFDRLGVSKLGHKRLLQRWCHEASCAQ